MTSRALRTVAVLIAIAGVVDPSFTADRPARPVVAIVAAPPVAGTDAGRGAIAAHRIAAALDADYRVVMGAAPDAAVTIVTGPRVPEAARASGGRGLVVVPADGTPALSIERLTAPPRAALDSRVPIDVVVQASAVQGPIVVTLEAGGVTLDRQEAPPTPDGTPSRLRLTYVPTAEGLAPLRVRASTGDGGVSTFADAAVDVGQPSWRVLVHDARPSWNSTFVRRALERDPRFEVRSVVASTAGVRTTAGGSAVALNDADAIAGFDVVILGAPAAIESRDVAALERYARARGGAIVLLMDDAAETRTAAARLAPLTGVRRWRDLREAEAAAIDTSPIDAAIGALAGAEAVAPEDAIASIVPLATGLGAGTAPVIYEVPIGAGRVIVSGALDAWQRRGVPGDSPFDAFWRLAVARAAAATPRALDVAIERAVLRPGETTTVRVELGDLVTAAPAAAMAEVTIGARLVAAGADGAFPAGGGVPVRVWPGEAPGRWRADLRAPESPGHYALEVTRGEAAVTARLAVVEDARAAEPDPRAMLEAWAASRDGATVAAASADDVRRALVPMVDAPREARRIWPMRSAWWIVPFAAAICGEWWRRRRADLR